MSDENHARGSAPDGERSYWLDQPENVNLLIKILIAAAVGVVLADLSYHKHGHFGFQEWFAFDAVFGFAAYVGLVNSAKLLRKLVMRPEGYYEGAASGQDAEEASDD
jgi:hypothetical protein